MEEKNYSKVPVFENGLAQPVFKFTDGKTGEKYDPATSSIVRYCVYDRIRLPVRRHNTDVPHITLPPYNCLLRHFLEPG